MRRGAGGCRGQASIEALALIPLLVLTVLLVWQLVVLVVGSLVAFERVRSEAVAARGSSTVVVREMMAVPSLLPGVGSLRMPVRAVVRAP